MSWLADLLRDPRVKVLNVDGVDRPIVHSYILSQKPMLKKVFTDFHHIFNDLDETYLSGHGARIEIGAGISPIKESYPDVLATDVVQANSLDQILDAENMDLPDNSVRVLFGQNCFHHLPKPDKFFRELERVVTPGGGCILLEPYYGPVATFLFRRMFNTEGYDKDCPLWETPIKGPMNGANQALSYIVFKRDREIFLRKHKNLEIIHEQLRGNYLSYLLSGGLNFRQLLPNCFTPIVSMLERLLAPLNRFIALHHVVVIAKKQKTEN